MKNILLFCLFMVLGNVAIGQSPTPGVTVIVHGFDALGGTRANGFESWQEHAISLREFAFNKTGQKATVFYNNPKTGFWQILEKDGGRYRQSTAQSYNTLGELIFVYDWTALSNDGMLNAGTGVGSSEAAADNLFAMLIQPVVAFPKMLGNETKLPIISSLPATILRNKDTHFIGHSRGSVILLQVLNRLKKYFPDVTIEHLTTLDPHPAAKMGDIESTELGVVSQSLPYIFGIASSCNLLQLCSTNNSILYRVPENVLKSDNYFRQGTKYEPTASWLKIAEFSGISVPNASHNRQLNNSMLSNNATWTGGAHSEVHNWYWGTFDRQFFNSGEYFTNDEGKSTKIPLIDVKNNDWYINGNIGDNFTFEGFENIGTTNVKIKSGYYYSRLGGNYNLLPVVTGQSTNNTNKRPIKLPFNNEFEIFSTGLSNLYFPGWEFNGGKTSGISSSNGWANFKNGSYLAHSIFYIPDNALKLKIVARKNPLLLISSPELHIRFRDQYDNALGSTNTKKKLDNSNFTEYSIDIPLDIRGKTGKIALYATGDLQIDKIFIENSSGTQLRVNNISNVLATATSYFDFPVTYNVNPTPLIKGVRPSSFNATIQNTLPSTWNGTLTMTWRKVSDVGRGIPLVSKGVSLAPNATVTLDRGTQQIISEVGDYVLAIYANNDEDPIDRYYFYVEEPGEVVSQSVSVTPSASNYGFGNTLVGGSASQTFTIKNTSTSNVSISNYALTGTGFVQGTTTCCGTLAPNASYVVNVLFQPNAVGAFNGNLQINGSFDGAPLNIGLSGTGYQIIPPANGCLESSVSSVNIITGNTDAPKQQFFALSNTSQSGSVTVNSIQFTGTDAQYFSYDPQLFSTPNTINPAISTGFMVKVNGNLTQNRNYNATLTFGTSNPSCPTLSLPVVAVNQNSSVSWVGPVAGYTAEYANGFARFDLQWQGYVQGATPIERAVQIQYSVASGTWTHVSQSSIDCTKGHSNDQINTDYFDLLDANSVGKQVQFRIKPCNTNVPWQYTGMFNVVELGFKPIRVISPNGYEVLTGGTTYDIKWQDLIGYKALNLAYSTDNGSTWISIATGVSGEASYYRWNVPNGIKSSNCLVKVTAANVSDQSDRTFTIQPPLASPINYSELSINPIGCNTLPNGSVNFRILGGTAPYHLLFVEAGLGMTTINASYVTGGMSGLDKGFHTVIITDANDNKASYVFYVPEKREYTVVPIVTNDICGGGKGSIQVNLVGDFPYPPLFTVSKNGQQIYSGNNGVINNLSAGLYSVQTRDAENCINEQVVFVDTSPGTYYPITPTITNTSCGSSTGAIALNVGTAQSPTFSWSNGATTQNLTNLSSNQYSVTVTDATGCVQKASYNILEDAGWKNSLINGYTINSNSNTSIEIENNKFYFPQYIDGNNKNRIGILSTPSHVYDYIIYNHPTNANSKPEIINFSYDGGFIGAVYKVTFPSNETHFVKFNATTKAIVSYKIINSFLNYSSVALFNNKLYCAYYGGIDILDFTTLTLSTLSLSFQAYGITIDKTNNFAFVCGFGSKIAKINLTNNSITEANTGGHGYSINQFGTNLYVTTNIPSTNNYILEKISSSNLSLLGSVPIKNAGFYKNIAFKSPNTVFVPSIAPNAIQIIDISTMTVKSEVSFSSNEYPAALKYDITTKRVYNAGQPISYLEDNSFEITETIINASCGLNNGSITLTIPNDGKTYTYLWSNGATTKDVSGLSAGEYTITVTQTGSCSVKKTITITQSSATFTATVSPNSGTLCPSQTIPLQATAGQSYVWYKDNVVINGATSQTYGVSQAGTYKVIVTNSSNCSATSNNVIVTVLPNPIANFTNSISGSVATFTNTSANGNQYLWSFGENTTSNEFSPVKAYSSNGTYSVTLRVTNSCGLFNEITKSVVITSVCTTPSATLSGTQTINSGQSATLSVSFTGASPWSFVVNGQPYSNISANPYTFSVMPSQTTTYTLASVSNVCGTGTVSGSAAVTVNNCNVTPPTTTGNNRCGAGTVMLSASNCAGTYNWYEASSGGGSLGTASGFTTPPISTTTTYYVSCTVENCASTRASAVATIGNIPSAPTIAPITINSGQTATLTASNCSGTVSWYSAATGSNFITSGASYTTPALTTTTTYYASCTVSGCESATRSSGTVTVNMCNVTPPITMGSSRCGAGSVTLGASGCNGTYTWYNGQAKQFVLGTGSSFTFYYTISSYAWVTCTIGSCESVPIGVVAIIITTPVAPTVASITVDNGQTATITTSNCSGTVNWYSGATGSNFITTGASYTTPALTANTTYYASCTVSGCESTTRNSGTVTVNPVTTPCPPTITHSTSVLAAGIYQAGQSINSQANVSTPTTYKAGQSILLTDGFQAGPNEIFEAKIQGCNTLETDAWLQKNNVPFDIGYQREGVVAFSINNKGYVVGGVFLWEYNPLSDQWVQKASLPANSHRSPFFVINNIAYLICNTTVWSYSPSSDTWADLGTAPGANKLGGFGFAIGNKGYISGGFYNNSSVYEYISTTNTWSQKSNMPNSVLYQNNDGVYRVTDARAFVLNGKGYMVGTNSYLAVYNPADDTWSNTGIWTNILGAYPTAFNIVDKGFIFCIDKLYEFNPATNTVILKKAFLGQKICYPIGFGVDGKGYVGLGGVFGDNTCGLTISQLFWQYNP